MWLFATTGRYSSMIGEKCVCFSPHDREGLGIPLMILRLLTPLKLSYETAKKRAEPYTKVVEELPEMRRDTVESVRRGLTENRRVYVLVNNRAAGNAPLTTQALVDQLRSE